MGNEKPFTLNIQKLDKSIYKKLQEENSPLRGRSNRDLFMLAMFIGFRQGTRTKLKERETYVRTEYFSNEDISIMKAVAIHESQSLEVLQDLRKVFSIVEEYANCGIKILKDESYSGGLKTFVKRFEESLMYDFEKISKG